MGAASVGEGPALSPASSGLEPRLLRSVASQLQGGEQVRRPAPGGTGLPASDQTAGCRGQSKTEVPVLISLGDGEGKTL